MNEAHAFPREVLLVNAKEAARILSISQRKLWQLKNCGEIPYVRIGRAVRYSPDELRKWIDRREGSGDA